MHAQVKFSELAKTKTEKFCAEGSLNSEGFTKHYTKRTDVYARKMFHSVESDLNKSPLL